MARMLKCPRCKRQTARVRDSYNPEMKRRFHQKFCSCGYEGRRIYWGQKISEKAYHKEMERMHKRIVKSLKEEETRGKKAKR